MTRRNCEHCQHYRPQTSYVDAYKEFDLAGPRGPIMKSLQELRKQETEALENESELQVELMRAELDTWAAMPRFAPVCVFGGAMHVPAVKNGNGQCGDFEPALNRQGKACRTCQFVVHPATKIGDRKEFSTGAGGTQETAFYRQLNKEQEDADATAQALEIEQTFYADGRLPVVSFLPMCAVRVTDGRRHIAPFCNLRNDCPEHRGNLTIPAAVLDAIRARAAGPNEQDVRWTIDLVKLIAQSADEGAAGFETALQTWSKGSADPAAQWGRFAAARWALDQTKNGTQVPAPPKFLPAIAGCDAYEWGMLASWSYTSVPAGLTAAAAICQQLGEFVSTTASPLEIAQCIECLARLVEEPGLFSPVTIARSDGFVKRLKAEASTLRLMTETDLQASLEAFAASLSYPVAAWIRMEPKEALRLAQLNPQLADQVRQSRAQRRDVARVFGSMILDVWPALANGTLPPAQRNKMLEELKASNAAAIDRDYQEQAAMWKTGTQSLAAKFGLPFDMETSHIGGSAIDETVGRFYEATRELELPRRAVLATMVFQRGMLPVTPAALDLQGKEPRQDRAPETVEEVLWDPVAKTVEALHAARFGGRAPDDRLLPYLRMLRRTATPVRLTN